MSFEHTSNVRNAWDIVMYTHSLAYQTIFETRSQNLDRVRRTKKQRHVRVRPMQIDDLQDVHYVQSKSL